VKFLVFGAGAVGGLVAARLTQADQDVTVVARGANLAAIRDRGITVHTPAGSETVHVRAVAAPVVDADTMILLAVKTQDVAAALRTLALAAPSSTPIACLTNGLEAERLALRWFAHVYAVYVNMPTTYLEPGVIEAWGAPITGIFDVGCYPSGVDARCISLAVALEAGRLSARAYDDIMRWKRGKLISNLTNALEALCGPESRTHRIAEALRTEGRDVLAAANLSITTGDEADARTVRAGQIAGRARSGGSTWQSLAREATVLECEYLNGEIIALGRLHGIATPLNVALLREVTRAAADRIPAGSLAIDDVVRRLTS
jgi:2-dehydropantoate 2-reductase